MSYNYWSTMNPPQPFRQTNGIWDEEEYEAHFEEGTKANDSKEENVPTALGRAWERHDYEMVISLIQANNFDNGDNLIDLWDQAHYCIAEKKKNRPLTSLERFRIRQKNLPPANICPSGKRRKISHPKQAVQILNTWFEDNSNYPYPGGAVMEDLSSRTGLSEKQVKTWFANARRKLKDPGCVIQEDKPTDSSIVDTSDSTPRDFQCKTPDTPSDTPSCFGDQTRDQTSEEEIVGRHSKAHPGPSFSELAEPRVNIVPPLSFPHGMNSGRPERPNVVFSWFREGYSNLPSLRYLYDNGILNTPPQACGSIDPTSSVSVQQESWKNDLPCSWVKQFCPNKTIVSYGEDIVRNAARILLHMAGKDKESYPSTPVSGKD